MKTILEAPLLKAASPPAPHAGKPHGPEFAIAVGAHSERGLRKQNQDQMSAFSSPFGLVYLVADGMGGHRDGAKASRIVAEGYRRLLAETDPQVPVAQALEEATAGVNRLLLATDDPAALALRDGRSMGSTVVLALIVVNEGRRKVIIGHIGDSRAYRLRDGSLERLTRDHSVVQRLVDEQLLTPEQARQHPNSSVLTRALGQQAEVQIQLSEPQPLVEGDLLLLCSDGLWGSLDEASLTHSLLAAGDLSALADALIAEALAAGSEDNVTVQLLHCRRPAGPTQGQFWLARRLGWTGLGRLHVWLWFLLCGIFFAALSGAAATYFILRRSSAVGPPAKPAQHLRRAIPAAKPTQQPISSP